MTAKTRTRWRAEIQQAPPSANAYMRLNRWRDQPAMKADWYMLLYAAFFHASPTKATGKRRVRVTVRSKNERDFSNQWLAVDKLIFDNLTKLGWLVDDKPKWMEAEIVSEVGPPRTVIELEEV